MKNIKVEIELVDNKTYLNLTGENKDIKGEEYLINIPRICLNDMDMTVNRSVLNVTSKKFQYPLIQKYNDTCEIKFKVEKDNNMNFFKIEAIVKEMTKENIEKELGYKIKII